jgi:glycosyltransferase involved in cell wall biosynthesis
MQPKVSILIPCHNAEGWIAKAIESALNQTYQTKEIIVVDDGSTDDSLSIIKSFEGSIRWVTGSNKGGNTARNRLLNISTGQWLQYLDADDYLLPYKIANQIECLETVPSVDILYGPSIYEYWDNEQSRQELLPIPEPHDPWILLARWYLPQTGSPLWRKQALIDVGGWKINQPVCQEHELYFRLLKNQKKFRYFDDAGSVYRQWSESTVCKRDQSFTRYHRLIIEDQIEQYLRKEGQLTQERLQAINQARFECARMEFLKNPVQAKQIMKTLCSSDPKFVPNGAAAPKSYQLFFRILGFMAAEKIAQFKRSCLLNA